MAVELLCQHGWPGNVRELKNVIEILITTTDSETITPADLPANISVPSYLIDDSKLTYSQARQKAMDDFNRSIINRSLMKNCGNVTRVAEDLRIDRGNLQRLMRKCRIVAKEFKENCGHYTSE